MCEGIIYRGAGQGGISQVPYLNTPAQCSFLKFSQNFSAVSYKTVSYNRILRVFVSKFTQFLTPPPLQLADVPKQEFSFRKDSNPFNARQSFDLAPRSLDPFQSQTRCRSLKLHV